MNNFKIPPQKNKKFIENFFIKKNLRFIVELSKKRKYDVNQMKLDQKYLPNLNDLYRLYQFVILNKRTTILEFGSGWSTLMFNLALKELKNRYSKEIRSLRRNNPFELFVLENQKKYLNATKNRIKKINRIFKIKNVTKINFYFSDVEMTLFNNRICTQYKKVPLCNPDFIYLDGPDQFNVKKNVNGISTNHKDMMPMSCDILKIEHFLTPGTIIISDGRAANSRFLKCNLQRNWYYFYDELNDQHLFYLNEKPLGIYSAKQLDYYYKS